jgi:hypothetical protein
LSGEVVPFPEPAEALAGYGRPRFAAGAASGLTGFNPLSPGGSNKF